jgi:oxalate decarboxylase/phosphoglucose isomerase-like protein (cupin superfamily)
MARVIAPADARKLGLPGRTSLEILSAAQGSKGVTLRMVEIPVRKPGDAPRGRHEHADFEECIYVLKGRGTTFAGDAELAVQAGDTIHIPPREAHVTHNTGDEPLVLLCFFPTADVSAGTEEGLPMRQPRGPL